MYCNIQQWAYRFTECENRDDISVETWCALSAMPLMVSL